MLDDPAFFDPRQRLDALAADLVELDLPLPPPAPLPFAIAGLPDAFGSMYVIEGSTLGGQLIARRVTADLGLAAAYHHGHGARSGAMWRDFQARLDSAITPELADATVAAANATFAHLRRWLPGD